MTSLSPQQRARRRGIARLLALVGIVLLLVLIELAVLLGARLAVGASDLEGRDAQDAPEHKGDRSGDDPSLGSPAGARSLELIRIG
jgi:hypothetical protein